MFNTFGTQTSDVSAFTTQTRYFARSSSMPDAGHISRLLDILIASAALFFFLPLMLLTALAISFSGGPVLFRQMRLGRGGELFPCLKFRTMHVDAEQLLADVLASDPVARECWEREHKLRRDPRVSFVGRFLRKTSLDELPQLFNVLAGTMSIVGPRPIVAAEARRYGRYIHTYCEVRPGITGLCRSAVGTRRAIAGGSLAMSPMFAPSPRSRTC